MKGKMRVATNGLSMLNLMRAETQAATCKGYYSTWLIIMLLAVLMAGCNGNSASSGGGTAAAPKVTATMPADGDTGVATDTKLTATFSKAMDPATINTTTFTVTAGETAVPGTVTLSGNGLTATFKPANDLTTDTSYTATITTGAKDKDGNAIEANVVWSFKTVPDTTAPKVRSTAPKNDAKDVPTNTKITATFSEVIDTATINIETFKVVAGATSVTGTVVPAADGLSATFTPDAELTAFTIYTATITTAVTDLAGNAMSVKEWTFKTGDGPSGTIPTVISTDPVNVANYVPVDSTISATFSEGMDKGTINTTNFTVAAVLTENTHLAGSMALSEDFKTATFKPASNLAADTQFIATVTTGVTDQAGNAMASNKQWVFTTGIPLKVTTVPAHGDTGVSTAAVITATFSAQLDPATIVSPATNFTVVVLDTSASVPGTVTLSDDGKTAIFTPTGGALAANTAFSARVTTGIKDINGNAMLAEKEWIFTTGATPSPQVVSTKPAPGATGVTPAVITATFSQAMDRATINSTNFTLALTTGGTSITGAVALSAEGLTATFTPASNLAANTAYSARVTTGVKDLSGNAMLADFEWSFKTAP